MSLTEVQIDVGFLEAILKWSAIRGEILNLHSIRSEGTLGSMYFDAFDSQRSQDGLYVELEAVADYDEANTTVGTVVNEFSEAGTDPDILLKLVEKRRFAFLDHGEGTRVELADRYFAFFVLLED